MGGACTYKCHTYPSLSPCYRVVTDDHTSPVFPVSQVVGRAIQTTGLEGHADPPCPQVVIEAIRPAGRESDVALDDVRLMHGDECDAVAPAPPSPSPPPSATRETVGERGRG